QWRQPLTHLSYIVMNIEDAFKHKSLDEKYMVKKVDEANSQIDFMSQTIEDFRDFYAPIKRKENFSIAEETEHILEIMKHILEEKDIEVRLLVKEDSVLKNYKNGYKQVMLNLLTNAKDALIENHVLKPCIEIMIEKEEVRVYDNAGGVEADKLQKIFEPYFTSKEKSLGIGLYMSKMIVEKSMEATLSVENTKKGACFKMVFKV
ncbi:MAG TPA: HAMP domain-containing histidine kinase, partial [Campylobacterales bacterium]|nr:HAMP domain-containing histidine kinase [Campylobacterales bacterium]